MADKQSLGVIGAAVSNAGVTTSGTIAAGSCAIIFDDASPLQDVMDQLEKAKLQVVGWYAKR